MKSIKLKCLLLIAFMLSLTACGDSNNSTSHTPSASITASHTTINVSGNITENSTPEVQKLVLSLQDESIDLRELYTSVFPNFNNNSSHYTQSQASSSQLELSIHFGEARYLPVGNHLSRYTITVCFDPNCNHPLNGSPIAVDVNYTITKLPDETALLRPTSRTEIQHNIIDAEFSEALNAIVIASSSPRNAVYVYPLDNTNVTELPLELLPKAINVANAGNSVKIAVGHDARITWIDFNNQNPNASAKKILNLNVDSFDLVASEEAVYVIPNHDRWSSLHRVDINTNSITQSDFTGIYGLSNIRMHPNLQSVYFASNGLSPDDISRYDITGEIPNNLKDSRYHGEYQMCGNLWISRDGNRLYTACGNTFSSSQSADMDMTYSGKLPLEQEEIHDPYRIQSLSESPRANEISLIQKQRDFFCDDAPESSESCTYYLSFFSKDFLNDIEKYAFSTVSINDKQYPEKPRYVFYSNDGDSVVILSELINTTTAKSYILKLDR